MLSRHLTDALKAAAAHYPVVTLTGPRQSGKTTLVQTLFGDYHYLSLEAPDVRARAIEDPRSFLTQEDRLILDEIQRVPELLSYIQGLVDADGRPGRFILTGSQNLLLMESVSPDACGPHGVFSDYIRCRSQSYTEGRRLILCVLTVPA